jgi:[ribosomal protein S5]-alanine N-acetyltransferase
MTNSTSMMELRTERLRLRTFRDSDATAFVALAGDFAVARMTSDIPHPLNEAAAAPWLRQDADEARFAIEYNGRLVGGVGYFCRPSGVGELGFWLGREYWGLGFATEAARAVTAYGFGAGRVPAFSSSHFLDNPASQRVLVKLGFAPSGQSSIWCEARKSMVPTMEYWLSAEPGARPDHQGWRSLLSKVLRQRHRPSI